MDTTLPDASTALSAPLLPVSFADALRFWLKLGFISFGGPAGQIAILHTELVERRRWISEKRFLHALNFCMLLPGPEAQQLATYIGWLMHRTCVASLLACCSCCLRFSSRVRWRGRVVIDQCRDQAGCKDDRRKGGRFLRSAWDGLVLHEGGIGDLRRSLCRAALRLPRRGRTLPGLAGAQMIDGLALDETTPGPLIMVVAFVGFVGEWLKQVLGSDSLFLAGALAATVVTFFTFLPSFIFILAGGPAIEATHGKLGFAAPLSAITAAVVGVILNLALLFAYHVLRPRGFGGHFDAISALIAVAAAIALFRFKVGVMPLLGACAAIGLTVTLLLPVVA